MKNILGILMGIVIGVILIGSMMAPTIEGIQKTAGDEITKSNEFGDYLYSDYSDTDFTAVVTFDATNGNTFTINGVTYDDYLRQTAILSSNFDLNLSSSTDAAAAGAMRTLSYTDGVVTGRVNQTLTDTLTIEYDHLASTITYTYGDQDAVTIETSDVLAISDEGNYVYVPNNKLSSVYTNEGLIETGQMGAFFEESGISVGGVNLIPRIFITKGVVHATLFASAGGANVTDNYDVTFDVVGLQTADGTTDILTGGVPTITVTNKTTGDSTTVTPSTGTIYGIVVKEVQGHATSGAAYSLYGAIIILAIAALLILGVRIFTNRD